jgi:hypothetical protein
MPRTKLTASRVVKMLQANTKAVYDGKITWPQFDAVNYATWDLAYAQRDDKLIEAVQALLRKAAA